MRGLSGPKFGQLFQLLVGELPYSAETLRRELVQSDGDVRLRRDPPKPSTRWTSDSGSPSSLRRALRSDLDWIVLKAMDPDRNRRYDSAAALAEDIERFTNHEPLVAGPPSTAVVVARWSELEDREPAYALVAEVDLVVVRFDDRVSVLYGRCLHRGALLADGHVEGRNLICGVHDWDYRLDTGVSEYSNDEALHRFTSWIDKDRDAVLVDEDERSFLKRLRADLDLSEFHASQMFEEELRRAQQKALETTTLDPGFLSTGKQTVELEGSSRVGFAEAVQSVIDESSSRLPGLAWADVKHVRVKVSDGRVVGWRVKLEAGVGEEG